MSPATQTLKVARQDFASDQEVRWCPGCGDYAILATVQKTLPLMNIPKENMVFISGIGCSSRFPYYLNTFGFHTLHGRAPTIATGLKLSRPELSVFVITGDGDGFSIGGNHMIHLMRRNVDLSVLLFNNRIYGLTKGQFSPTSEQGKKTKSSPFGSQEEPLEPILVALGARCSFIARTLDVDSQGLQEILLEAVAHQGTSFIEIYQNCNVFNDGAFENLSDRTVRQQHTIFLRPGKPMLFNEGKEGLDYQNGRWIKVAPEFAKIHSPDEDEALLWSLAQLRQPDMPVAMGIFKKQSRPAFQLPFDSSLQGEHAKESLEGILKGHKYWST